MFHMQDFGYSEEQTFTTAPEAGADSTVKLLAIADLGYCEEDGSMTTPGNYRNPVAVQPIGTTAEVITEVGSLLSCSTKHSNCLQATCSFKNISTLLPFS